MSEISFKNIYAEFPSQYLHAAVMLEYLKDKSNSEIGYLPYTIVQDIVSNFFLEYFTNTRKSYTYKNFNEVSSVCDKMTTDFILSEYMQPLPEIGMGSSGIEYFRVNSEFVNRFRFREYYEYVKDNFLLLGYSKDSILEKVLVDPDNFSLTAQFKLNTGMAVVALSDIIKTKSTELTDSTREYLDNNTNLEHFPTVTLEDANFVNNLPTLFCKFILTPLLFARYHNEPLKGEINYLDCDLELNNEENSQESYLLTLTEYLFKL